MSRRIVLALLLSGLLLSGPAQPSLAAPTTKPAAAGQATVAVFTLKHALRESPAEEGLPIFQPPGLTLRELTSRMARAARDPGVKAIVVIDQGAMYGLAQAEEIRQTIRAARDAGKDVYVHADYVLTLQLPVYTAASRLSVVPTGHLLVYGLSLEAPYLRGLLDKIGAEPQFLTCGAYKSAAELFTRTGPSREAEEMYNWLADGLFDGLVRQVAAARDVEPARAKGWIDAGLFSAESAKEAGLIDAVEHRHEFEAMLKQVYGENVRFDKRYGAPAQPKIDFANPFAVFQILAEAMGSAKRKPASEAGVAIVYVDGMIVPGKAQPSIFGSGGAYSSDIREALREAEEDEAIKAVVLRVDSQGGSAVASEIIRDATLRVKARKPIVVSMGNVAGSGGYYVASGVDTIFADEMTLTGSIGVLGGKLVTTPMWEKIGITFKDYRRGAMAGAFSSSTPWTDAERQALQTWMDEVYAVFKKHVTDTRGERLKKPIDELAGGRVFTGKQAHELGLVDRLGTLNDAIAYAAEQAKLGQDYDVRVVPEPKNLIQKLMEEGGAAPEDPSHIAAGAGMRGSAGAGGSLLELARPLLRQLDPQRVAGVEHALRALDVMRAEQVLMWMPEVAR